MPPGEDGRNGGRGNGGGPTGAGLEEEPAITNDASRPMQKQAQTFERDWQSGLFIL